MAKLVALKLKGESGFYLVDLDAMTVEPMQNIVADAFGYTAAAQSAGAAFVRGVDVAVVTLTRADAYAGKYDT